MGKYSNSYPPTGINFCSSGMTAPQGIEMENWAKIRAETKHHYVTHLISNVTRKQEKKNHTLNDKWKEEEKIKD